MELKMKHRTAIMILSVLALLSLPGYLSAQETTPPPCCNKDDPPPSPPPPDLSTEGETTALSQVIVSDAALSKAGMTRSQFLDALAAVLFSDTDQTYDVLIPVYTQVTAADGTTSVQIDLVQMEKSKVTPEVLSALDFVLITNGETYVVVVFEGIASD
jgi:hypothetical protein